jgi:hypothetical protein
MVAVVVALVVDTTLPVIMNEKADVTIFIGQKWMISIEYVDLFFLLVFWNVYNNFVTSISLRIDWKHSSTLTTGVIQIK